MVVLRFLLCSRWPEVASRSASFASYNHRFDFIVGALMAQPVMATLPALKDSFTQLRSRMDKAVEDFRREMASTRTGRASVHMLDGIKVEYYGEFMPLNQIAQIHAPEAQLITVQPFDPSSLATIEKAVRGADLG